MGAHRGLQEARGLQSSEPGGLAGDGGVTFKLSWFEPKPLVVAGCLFTLL